MMRKSLEKNSIKYNYFFSPFLFRSFSLSLCLCLCLSLSPNLSIHVPRTIKSNHQAQVASLESEIRLQRMQLMEFEERINALQAGGRGAGCALCENYEQQVCVCVCV